MRKLFIILAAAAFVVAYTVPALAADWSFKGTVRVDTYWQSLDKEVTGTGFDDDDFYHELSDGRLSASVKGDNGLSGKFEYGEAVNLRYFWGAWDFGAGSILVGQDDGLINYGCAECNIRGGSITDGLYESRVPQVTLSIGSFRVGLIENAATNKDNDLTGAGATWDTDVGMPKIEAEFALNLGPAAIELVGGYNSFDRVDDTGATECEYGVDSYVVGLGAAVNFGPATVKLAISQSQNGDNYGLDNAEELYPVISGTQVLDVERLGWQLMAGYKVSDTVSFAVGYGSSTQEIDEAGVKVEDTFSSYYAVATIFLSKGFRIQPEYYVIDYDEVKVGTTTTQEGEESVIGLRWRVDF